MPKILLVEDDNNLREIFQMRLIAEGYDTVTAGNGEEGLVVAMKEKPDLIISDVMMPKLSGFEMMETLRAAPEMADTKAIMMTALGQAEDRARGEKLGVLKYLVKSQVTLEDFVRVVREVIQPDQTATGTTAVAAAAPANSDQIQNNQESETHMPPADPATNPAPADGGTGTNPISSGVPADTSQPTTEQEQNAVQDQINSFVSGSDAAAAVPAEPAAAPTDVTPAADASAAAPAPAAPAEGGSVFGGEPTVPVDAPAAPAPVDTTAPEVPASTEPAQDAPTPPASSEGTGGAL